MGRFTIRQIEEKLCTIRDREAPLLKEFERDERKGVQQLVKKWYSKMEQEKQEKAKFDEMNVYERKYRHQGFQFIAGIDEVGRGPLAGPVVAAAVILPAEFYLPGVDDSKKLSEQKREEFYEYITENALSFGVGIIEAKEIDEINIYEATKKAMLSAVNSLEVQPDFLLIDAVKLSTPYPYDAIIKGDGKSVSIASASIIAKVTRDRIMKQLGSTYPQYGFVRNMGYGTKEHLAAIKEHGITPIHRKSFAPIKEFIFQMA